MRRLLCFSSVSYRLWTSLSNATQSIPLYTSPYNGSTLHLSNEYYKFIKKNNDICEHLNDYNIHLHDA